LFKIFIINFEHDFSTSDFELYLSSSGTSPYILFQCFADQKMFKSKPLIKHPQPQPQNPTKAKIFSQKEDLTLQLKYLKLNEEPNFERLMKNIPSIKKRNKFEVASPLTAKLGEVENVEMEMENIEKLMNHDEVYDLLYGQTYESQLYANEVIQLMKNYKYF
jgi:hypothetical protein